MNSELKKWKNENEMIPLMIIMYCRSKHRLARKQYKIKHSCLCQDCYELMQYTLYRLSKCPFKENKGFCSFCKINCYKSDMREKMRKVMRYSGYRMVFRHPIIVMAHLKQQLKYKLGIKRGVKK